MDNGSHADPMKEIIDNCMKAIGPKRWLSIDQAQPDTVEFWLRIFKAHLQHSGKTPGQWTEMQIAFVKFITREALQSTASKTLDAIIPHLKALDGMAPDHIPMLARAVCKLSTVDCAAAPAVETSECTVHAWLQEHAPLSQLQFLCSSPLYHTFLKSRFTEKLNLAKKTPGHRRETIRVMLESASPGSAEHAALVFAQTIDDEDTPLLEKLRLLWCTPKADELLAEWNLTNDGNWDVLLHFRDGGLHAGLKGPGLGIL